MSNQDLKQTIKKFAEKSLLPFQDDDEQKGIFRKEIFEELGNLGLTGLTTEEKYGGAGLDYQTLCFVLQELARYSVSYAVTLSVSHMVQSMIQQFGTDAQKITYLPPLASGKEIGAFSLSESHAGSDAASLKTRATKVKDGYELQGQKMWVTSGGIASTYLVMAQTPNPEFMKDRNPISAFIIEDKTPGFTQGKAEKKMGWKCSPTRELLFEKCFIPKQQLLGSTEGMGLKMALAALERGRFTIASIALGLALEAFDQSLKYAKERQQFGTKIFDFQGLQFLLAEDATSIASAKTLVEKAAQLYDEKKPSLLLSAMAKMRATDMAMTITTNAVQILGGVGFTQEYPLERMMRDAKGLQIVEGTNQIQKMVISRELQKFQLSDIL